jgi:glucose dehydrogenase
LCRWQVGKQTVVFPGFDGGAEWGGPAIDPATNILYVNASEMAWTGGWFRRSTAAVPGNRFIRASARCATAAIGLERRLHFLRWWMF